MVLTGSVPVLPRSLLESLTPGGRAFAVIGEGPLMTACIISRSGSGSASSFRTLPLFETVIAPLLNCERPSRFTF